MNDFPTTRDLSVIASMAFFFLVYDAFTHTSPTLIDWLAIALFAATGALFLANRWLGRD